MIQKIENEFKELVRNLEIDEVCTDELTQEDLELWGYDNWEDFWESNM